MLENTFAMCYGFLGGYLRWIGVYKGFRRMEVVEKLFMGGFRIEVLLEFVVGNIIFS